MSIYVKAAHTCGYPNHATAAKREQCPRCRQLAERYPDLYYMSVPRNLAEAHRHALIADGTLAPLQPMLPGMEAGR